MDPWAALVVLFVLRELVTRFGARRRAPYLAPRPLARLPSRLVRGAPCAICACNPELAKSLEGALPLCSGHAVDYSSLECSACGAGRVVRGTDPGCLECELQDAFAAVHPTLWRQVDELLRKGRGILAVGAVRAALPSRFGRGLLLARELVRERVARVERVCAPIEWLALPPPESARCPVCATTVGTGSLQCAACETYHHAECWEYAGNCGIYACGSAAHQ